MAIGYVTGLCYTMSNGIKKYEDNANLVGMFCTVPTVSNKLVNTVSNPEYYQYSMDYDADNYTYIGTTNNYPGFGKNFLNCGLWTGIDGTYFPNIYWLFDKNTTNKTLSRSILFGFLVDYNSSEQYVNEEFGATISIESQYSDDGPLNDTLELKDFDDVTVGSNHIKYYKITHEITYSEDSHKQLDDVIPIVGDPAADVYFQLNSFLSEKRTGLNFIYKDSRIILNFGCFFTDQYNTKDGTHLDSAFYSYSNNFITISGNQDDYSWKEISENTHYRRKSRKNSGQVDIYIDLNSTKITIEFSNMIADEIQNTIFDSTFNLKSRVNNKNDYGPNFYLNFTI